MFYRPLITNVLSILDLVQNEWHGMFGNFRLGKRAQSCTSTCIVCRKSSTSIHWIFVVFEFFQHHVVYIISVYCCRVSHLHYNAHAHPEHCVEMKKIWSWILKICFYNYFLPIMNSIIYIGIYLLNVLWNLGLLVVFLVIFSNLMILLL